MTVAHSTLTGSDLHEPKGVASATSGQVYIANGSGSGTWTNHFQNNVGYAYGSISDISTAQSIFLPLPFNCTVTNIYVSIKNAITVANSTVTCKNNAGTSMASTLSATFSGSTAGTTYTAALTTNNTFTAGQRIEIATDGASSTAAEAWVLIKYTITA